MESEERLENWDNVRHAFENLPREQIDWNMWHKRIVDRYQDGSLSIHLHVSGLLIGQRGDWCIVCESWADRRVEFGREFSFPCFAVDGCINQIHLTYMSPDDLISLLANNNACADRTTLDDNLHRDRVREGDCEKRLIVFVMVYEGMQKPERLIPSVLRLQSLDSINRRCGEVQAFQLSARPTLRGPGIAPQWEVGGSISASNTCRGILPREFCRDVIQTGPKAAEEITKDEPHFDGGGDRQNSRFDYRYIVFSVVLSGESIWCGTDVSTHFDIQGSEVLLCPDDFSPRAV